MDKFNCPYCNKEYSLWDYFSIGDLEEEKQIDCECNNSFGISFKVEYSFELNHSINKKYK